MPKELLRRYLPKADEIRANPALRPLGYLLDRPEIWHLNRRTVAGAAFIGLFCAFLPIPMQMLAAAALVLPFRCNLPIAVALVWISNPFTVAPIFYFTYRLGAWLLNMQVEAASVELSLVWLWQNLGRLGYPLLFGSLVCAWVAGVSGFVIVRVLWRLHAVRRWQARRALRRRRRAKAGGRAASTGTRKPGGNQPKSAA